MPAPASIRLLLALLGTACLFACNTLDPFQILLEGEYVGRVSVQDSLWIYTEGVTEQDSVKQFTHLDEEIELSFQNGRFQTPMQSGTFAADEDRLIFYADEDNCQAGVPCNLLIQKYLSFTYTYEIQGDSLLLSAEDAYDIPQENTGKRQVRFTRKRFFLIRAE